MRYDSQVEETSKQQSTGRDLEYVLSEVICLHCSLDYVKLVLSSTHSMIKCCSKHMGITTQIAQLNTGTDSARDVFD